MNEARALFISSVWTITASERAQLRDTLMYERIVYIKAIGLLTDDNLDFVFK
jgi:hypothetical protein